MNQTHQESSKNIIVKEEKACEAHNACENMKRSLGMTVQSSYFYDNKRKRWCANLYKLMYYY